MGLNPAEYGLIVVLAAVILAPLLVPRIRRNLEAFLFLMGLCAAFLSQSRQIAVVEEAIGVPVVIGTMLSVIAIGFVAHYGKSDILQSINSILLDRISLKVIFLELVVVLGLLAAIITPILSLFVLVEAINHLPLHQRTRAMMTLSGSASILLGAAVSLAEEPSSVMAGSRVQGTLLSPGLLSQEVHSFYLILGIIALGLASAFFAKEESNCLGGIGLEKASAHRRIAIWSVRACLFAGSLLLIGAAYGANW